MSDDAPPWTWPEARWRDLAGRVRARRSLKPARWPGGARFAVALSFDCDHETFELGQGRHAVGRLASLEFGRRVGVPRILSILASHNVPATFFWPAVAALLGPDQPRACVAAGHEVGLHGWIHENTSLLDEATERALIARARATLEDITQTRVVGHRAANWDVSPHTIPLVADAGLLYDSSLMGDEDPYEPLANGAPTGLVEIPVEWLRDDAVYLLFNRNPPTRPWLSPEEVFRIFQRECDAAAAERGVFQLVLHPFVLGYRSRVWILDALIRHARDAGGAWFCTHADLARWVKEQT